MTWQRYGRYRPSGVEWPAEAPAHWSTKRLRFALRMNPSRQEAKRLAADAEVSFVTMDAVGEQGGLRLDSSKPLDDIPAGYTYFADGDVVVAKITPCFENGKGALAEGLLNGCAFGTTELQVLRAEAKELDPKFLFYLTASQPFRKLGEAAMYGAGGQKRVPEDFIKDFRAALPPLSEQQQIADRLDRETARLDSLIDKRQRMIKLLQEKRAALITHAVTRGLDPEVPLRDSGVEWLGRIPEHWEVKWLASLADIQTGPFGSQLHAHEYLDDQVPVINPAEIRSGAITPDWSCTLTEDRANTLARHRVTVGDLLFARRGEMGRCGIVTHDQVGWICGTGCLLVRTTHDSVQASYLNHFFMLRGVREYLELVSVGSTMMNLNTSLLGRLPVLLPPRDEQAAIEKQLNESNRRLREEVDWSSAE